MAPVPRPPSGHFNILYFASASSFTKKEYESLAAPLPLGKLFQTLDGRYSGMKARILDSCMVTINLEYIDVPTVEGGQGGDEVVIKEGDEVAIIPPVSSG